MASLATNFLRRGFHSITLAIDLVGASLWGLYFIVFIQPSAHYIHQYLNIIIDIDA